MSRTVYLAGPEVFLEKAEDLFHRKKELCKRYGFIGVSPLDELEGPSITETLNRAFRISHANEDKLRKCDFLIANITPFRSPSADIGTAYEMGFMRSQDRMVLAYTNHPIMFRERTLMHLNLEETDSKTTSEIRDANKMSIESFGLVDNLMIDGSVFHSGSHIVLHDISCAEQFTDLKGFEDCLKIARSKEF